MYLILSILCYILHGSVEYLHTVLQGVKLSQVQGTLRGEAECGAQEETKLSSKEFCASHCHNITNIWKNVKNKKDSSFIPKRFPDHVCSNYTCGKLLLCTHCTAQLWTWFGLAVTMTSAQITQTCITNCYTIGHNITGCHYTWSSYKSVNNLQLNGKILKIGIWLRMAPIHHAFHIYFQNSLNLQGINGTNWYGFYLLHINLSNVVQKKS